MNFSVGDFAENLILQDQISKKATSQPSFNPEPSFYSNNVTEQAPDISNIEVPSTFINDILEGKSETKIEPKQETKDLPVVESSDILELKSMFTELKSMLSEIKVILTEVTTVGSGIGAPNFSKEKEKGEKEEDPEDQLEQLLKKIKRMSKR